MNFYIGTTRGNAMGDLTWVYAEKPFVPRGPDGSFDKDMIFPASQIVTHNNRHWVYYNGFRERHGIPDRGPHGIGLATLKRDRFISLTATGAEPGTILTKPFRLEGSQLQVNGQGDSIVWRCSTKPVGSPTPPSRTNWMPCAGNHAGKTTATWGRQRAKSSNCGSN